VKSLSSTSFAPAGITDDPEIRTASSLVDYIFRRLALTYLSFDDRLELGLASMEDMPEDQTSLLDDKLEARRGQEELVDADVTNSAVSEAAQPASTAEEKPTELITAASRTANSTNTALTDNSAPLCYNCGNQTQKAGSCYVCTSCGSTTGCS
jgi:ribonucleoside-diphosphate reductase alpha chain